MLLKYKAFLEKLGIGEPSNIGIIEDEYGEQYQINGKWYHKSLVNDDVIDIDSQKINNIISKLEQENGYGVVTLYHGTDIDSYNKIMETGIFGQDDTITFLTSTKEEAIDYAKMKAKYRNKEHGKVLYLTIPKWSVRLNSGTGEYETEFVFKQEYDMFWYPTEESILKYGE